MRMRKSASTVIFDDEEGIVFQAEQIGSAFLRHSHLYQLRFFFIYIAHKL